MNFLIIETSTDESFVAYISQEEMEMHVLRGCIHRESGVGPADFVVNDDPIAAGAKGEESGTKDVVPTSTLPGIDPLSTYIKSIPLSEKKQSSTLFPAIKRCLEEGPIDFIAVGTGPGSFTGTRVGVMAAKSLAFAVDLPILPFCSLKCYTPTEEGPFKIYGDAKSQGYFLLKGEKIAEKVTFNTPKLVETGEKNTRPLNIPFLATHLQEAFKANGAVSPKEVSVSYMRSL